MKLAASALVGLSLAASIAFAQTPAPVPTPAPTVTAPTVPPAGSPLEKTVIVPLTPETVAAQTQAMYQALRAQVEKGRATGAISAERYAEISSKWADLSAQMAKAADDAARVSSYLGDNRFVFGILVTYGMEYILGFNGKVTAFGGSGEVGVAGFVSNNFDFVMTGVFLGAVTAEQTWDINHVQNRSQPDRGFRVKLLFSRKRVSNIAEFAGAYLGAGLDVTKAASGKIYLGGCFNSDEFVRAELEANGTLKHSDKAYDKAWQIPYNFVRERVANCNSAMLSVAFGKNDQTPPWSLVEKGIWLTFPASNRGFGNHPSDIWRYLKAGIWE